MDEEDHCDYSTPIGRIIQHINVLCKKPKVDGQLDSALELFAEKITEQQRYLKNGIFTINFAEAALFLQSCATLYGKKIDILWEQLLEFHTRLIRYDCENAKEKGKKLDKNVIQQLEERRNRYKRKKKFKLLEPDTGETKEILFDVPDNSEKNDEIQDERNVIGNDDDDDFNHFWKHLEVTNENMEKVPKIVDEQQRKRYRLENYPIMESEDFDIYDIDDGEFNTKYSRVPGWHHIDHLIEYNTQGLLPDNHNIIANFRLSSYGRLKFMRERKIPLSTPYEVYEKEYLIYKQKFFEEEAKKWQNMPLNTFEDLHRQLEFLAEMERERDNPKRVSGTSPTPNKDTDRVIHCCEDSNETVSSTDSLVKIIENSDNDSLFELSFQCDEDMCKSDLFIRLEKLSSDIINTKLRQDSGFYDYISDTSSVYNEDNGVPKEVEKSAELICEININSNENGNTKENFEQDVIEYLDYQINEVPPNKNDFDTRSIISDHDYCTPTCNVLSEKNNNTTITNMNIINKENVLPLSNKSTVIPKIMNINILRAKTLKDKENDSSPPTKRRKLSQKQFVKLVSSLVPAVKGQKFEKFFSLNYQPQLGEGIIEEVQYESTDSDSEDEDINLENKLLSAGAAAASSQSRQDDNRSIFSDHDYCQPFEESNSFHDSGFCDALTGMSTLEEHGEQSELINPEQIQRAVEETVIDQVANAEDDTPTEITHVDEVSVAELPQTTRKGEEFDENYIKLLAALRESRREGNEGVLKTTEELRLEQQRKLREKEESRARVNEWRTRMTPILKDLKESDFDIHEYGTRIMDDMELNESKPFKNIVNGKSSAEVVRYFISSLQLANTNNIEICGAIKGGLSNDSYHVKMLKRDRYHEHLTEYQAPSAETFRQRLQRMRNTEHNQAEVSSEPKPKRVKVSKPTKQTPTKTYRKKMKSPILPIENRQVSIFEEGSSQAQTTVPMHYAEPSTSCCSNDSLLSTSSVMPNYLVQSPPPESHFRQQLEDMRRHNTEILMSSTPRRDRTDIFMNVSLERSELCN